MDTVKYNNYFSILKEFNDAKKDYSNLIKIFSFNSNINYKELNDKLPYTRKSTSGTAIKHLKTAFINGDLNLVLGSGISSNYGLPSWDELLQKLLIKTYGNVPNDSLAISKLFTLLFNPSPLIAGRYLQESLKDNKDLHKFENEVRATLYENYDNEMKSPIMDEIVKFCVAPGNTPNLDGIITYNYDDILEAKLKSINIDIPFQSIYGQGIDPDNKSLSIYHVHGFLPQSGKINNENAITLGEFVYHEQYNNIYSWNNIVQINKFRDKTCLFIGTSLTDPNTRRLLDIANSQKKSNKFHYVLKKQPNKSQLKENVKKLVTENPELMSPNDNLIDKIDEFVDFLTDLKQRFDEKDSDSLGVKTVWVEDFDEDIPDILEKIREI